MEPASRRSTWVKAIMVLYFDLEFGQKIEVMYPPDVRLTKEEESNICFLSFPDSHSNATGDTVFQFRFPRVTEAGGATSLSVAPVHLNGYVFNRVRRDTGQKRGYLQKSVVIMTERSDVLLWPLFRHVAAVVGAEYFNCVATIHNGTSNCEAAAAFLCSIHRDIVAWPDLSAGTTMELPLLGNVFQFFVATDEFFGCGYDGSVSQIYYGATGSAPVGPVASLESGALCRVSSLDELSVYQVLFPVLADLWTLWEILLVGEPLVVFGHTPEQTSAVVAALVSLILPLHYGGEWRPYFTIHDSDFRKFASMIPLAAAAAAASGAGGASVGGAPSANANVLVGVTNPFFLREFKDWPNKLMLAPEVVGMFGHVQKPGGLAENDPRKNVSAPVSLSSSAPATAASSPTSNGGDVLPGRTSGSSGKLGPAASDSAKRAQLTSSRVGAGGGVTVSELETRYKCLLHPPNRALMEELMPLKGSRGNAGDSNWRDINGAIARSNNRIIRRHFYERTQKFLVPLESYFTSLMPVIPSSQSAGGPQALQNAEHRIRAFDKAEFLKRVAEQSSGLLDGSAKKRVELYRRFLNSRSFDLWYFEKMRRTYLHIESVRK